MGRNYRFRFLFASIILIIAVNVVEVSAQDVLPVSTLPLNSFPASLQFSPGASADSNAEKDISAVSKTQQIAIDGIVNHGFSSIWFRNFTGPQSRNILNYAQSQHMKVDFMTNGFELFNRYDPSPVSVYSSKYPIEVKRQVDSGLAPIRHVDHINFVFPFQDEPFHGGPKSFDYTVDARNEFYKRYGYAMPDSVNLTKLEPKKWLDLLNFQSNTFRDGWQQVYKIVKDFDPHVKIAMTHDSHNPFGAGVKSNSKIAIDDVFHWGGNFADLYVYDIYPYLTFDYRYGELGKLPKPRISQMHYAISQLRNVTNAYNKDLGFWVGTYNEAWFTRFRGPERQHQYWSEREMSYTAIAQGANYIISPSNYSGENNPVDEGHWEAYGKGMRVIQKAGPGLLLAPKVKAKACFLFPRTQYLQLQEEYFNVGLSFELFLRSFGELDILHEEQVTDDNLNGYEVLVLMDVKLLPVQVAKHIDGFVRKGGIVIADCLPQMGEYKQPMDVMAKLFGVESAETGRVIQEGQWVPFTMLPPKMSFPPPEDQKLIETMKDVVTGKVGGHNFNFPITSPRNSTLSSGEVKLRMKSGQPALVEHITGKGKTWLLGFCLQDTYFQTFKDSNELARGELHSLVRCLFNEAKIQSHIYSSNPDIEAAVRAGAKEGYAFVINHESVKPQTTITLADLGFHIGKIIDIETGKEIPFIHKKNSDEFTIKAPFGTTRLLSVLP